MGLQGCSRLNSKARSERIQVGIGVDLGAINVKFFAPDQLLLLALFHNRVEEAAKDLNARLAHEYASNLNGQAMAHLSHIRGTTTWLARSAACRINCRSERISSKNMISCSLKNTSSFNGGTPTTGIGLLHQLTHQGEIECVLQVPIEVILRHQLF